MKKIFQYGLLMLLIGKSIYASGQNQDTSRQKLSDQIKNSQLAKKALGSITKRNPADTMFNIRSEASFMPYDGKIIRKIYFERIGFDRTIVGTARSIKTFVTKAANVLHNNTKWQVIRNNIFLKEGQPLNPYRVADNERYLRDLDFILDSRIFVLHESEGTDSVDLLVMTRDVFSIGVNATVHSSSDYKLQIQDANLAGLGQRLQLSGKFDSKRHPGTGGEFLYKKVNLFGSFIDGTFAYNTINTGTSVGGENESAYFFRLNRMLFNPFTKWAGALEYSKNWSANVYQKPDNAFARYRYTIQDFWVGYSFSNMFLHLGSHENRNRTFVAIRAYKKNFSELPVIPLSHFDQLLYFNRMAVLGQATLFKQDFFKTRYVLGFGRTEDIPSGYRISFTGGWEKELQAPRAYTAGEFNLNRVHRNGTFYTYSLKLASYWRVGKDEDALTLLNITRYSKAYTMGRYKARHQDELGYTQQFHQQMKKGIDIRDVNGLYGFRPDSLLGVRRLKLSTETVLFTPWKILGFHLAPLVRIDLAYLAQAREVFIQKQNFFSGFSTALRARNENLIFNTVEARIYYFPKTVESLSSTRIEFRVNLRIKYPTGLVTAPATVYDP